MNREAWLTQMAERHLWPLIEANRGHRHKYRISVGFPKGSRGRRASIGQCWTPRCSADGTYEIFISPELSAHEAVHVALHEFCHVSDELKSGHKGEFARLAKAVGLEGKMTATVPNLKLSREIDHWIEDLGKYPHAPLTPSSEKAEGPGSRLIKCECAGCGFVFRTTHKWLQASGGMMQCPMVSCDGEVMVS